MAEHALTTPATLARRRHTRAAPGAPDRRRARLLRQPVTPALRARIERDIELLIELLDVLEGDTDQEADHEGCCEAGDDDPASSQPSVAPGGCWGPGDPADAEPSDGTEPDGGCLDPADGHGLRLMGCVA